MHDVDRVRERRDCSVLDACGYLADGEFSETLPVRINGVSLGWRKIVWGKWKGMDIQTLERKYYLEKARENARRPNFST